MVSPEDIEVGRLRAEYKIAYTPQMEIQANREVGKTKRYTHRRRTSYVLEMAGEV